MNFYDFHIGDYTTRTAHLEPMEDLAYRRMLDLYYLREQPLPQGVADIARLIRLRGQEDAIQAVLDEFFESDGESGWLHAKCEEVIAAAQCKRTKAKESAAKRWECERNANAMPTQCEGNAPTSQYPVPSTQEEEKAPRKRVATDRPADIDEAAWTDWQAVRRAKRAGPVTETVLKAIRREAAKCGVSANQAVQACAEYGWQGFEATWFAARKAQSTVSKACSESFAEQNARVARERVAAFAPGIAVNPSNNVIEVFDVPAIASR